jgi:hypothetical protein
VRELSARGRKRTWPCKIGCSDRDDPKNRVAEYTNQTGVFEAPEIGFQARTDNPTIIETTIHNWFKDRNRWLREGEGVGDEWFEVSLHEVRRAYREAVHPTDWLARIWLSWRMEISASVDERRRKRATRPRGR